MRSRTQKAEQALSVITYCTFSISTILMNKLLLYTFKLPYPNCILFLQNGGAVVLVVGAKQLGWINYPDFSLSVVKRWLPLTFFFVMMLFTSMKSLHTMSVSAQTILKNMAMILTAIGDKYLYSKTITIGMYVAFAMMIVGSCLGAHGDNNVTAWGLFWTLLNVAFTTGYSLYMKRITNTLGAELGRYGPVFYNNILSLPFIVVCGWSEFSPFFAKVRTEASIGALVCLVFSTIISSGMTFTVFWCMQMTSPTTHSVAGSLNKVPLTFLGMIIFNQYPNAVGYVGVVLALMGGMMYSHFTLQANKKKPHDEGPLLPTRAADGPTGKNIL